MADSPIKDKSYKFAVRIIQLCKELNEKESMLSAEKSLERGLTSAQE